MTRRTVRVRLTALYSGLFLATCTVLLVVVNLLLQRMLDAQVADVEEPDPPSRPLPPLPGGTGGPPNVDPARIVSDLRDEVLRFQWGVTAATVAVLTAVSVVAGWWLAGRVLRPLHRITATARRLSLSTIDERIGLDGPRDELKELADTFDAMLDRLQRSVDDRHRFVANASHELRTPLAIQRAAIEIGLDDPSPDRIPQVREELLEANRRTERLIDGLLMLARGDEGLDAREPVPLHSLVAQVANETAVDDVGLELDIEPVTVSGDPLLLTRLVANLLDNAVRYNHPGGRVEVTLSHSGALTVRNTGPEVPEERIGELFEPFRRLHTARTRSSQSTGLGLSIVASIARAHDADIDARPNAGGGLELTVRFPAPDPVSAASEMVRRAG